MNGAIPMRLRTHFRSERCQEPYCIAKSLDSDGWLGDQRMVQGQEVNGVGDLQQFARGVLGVRVFVVSGVFNRYFVPLASREGPGGLQGAIAVQLFSTKPASRNVDENPWPEAYPVY